MRRISVILIMVLVLTLPVYGQWKVMEETDEATGETVLLAFQTALEYQGSVLAPLLALRTVDGDRLSVLIHFRKPLDSRGPVLLKAGEGDVVIAGADFNDTGMIRVRNAQAFVTDLYTYKYMFIRVFDSAGQPITAMFTGKGVFDVLLKILETEFDVD